MTRFLDSFEDNVRRFKVKLKDILGQIRKGKDK